MRKLLIFFTVAVWLSVLAWAQDTSSSQSGSQDSTQTSQQGTTSTQSPDQSGSSAAGGMGQSTTSSQGTTSSTEQGGSMSASTDKSAGAAKLHHLKGTIGQDGKTFTSDKDSKSWTIINPDAVQGHEGHHVRLSAHVYPDKDQIHVMSVKMAGEKSSKAKGGSENTSSGQPPQQ
jgi:hypothetical protein